MKINGRPGELPHSPKYNLVALTGQKGESVFVGITNDTGGP